MLFMQKAAEPKVKAKALKRTLSAEAKAEA
jgi:hypothetical protein